MKRLDERVPTVSFTLEGQHPRDVAEKLGKEGFYVWDGHYYALAVVERLGLLIQAAWCVARTTTLSMKRRLKMN
jgi:selenocysteine lyase/cysteine desulfurase